ncbi:MAG: isochorismatase family protein [Gammaproteobacteria bacterium]|jgi:nicotinamidase-related amidase
MSRVLSCQAERSLVVVVDIQQRLGDAMPGKVLNRVLLNTTLLARSSGLLDIPVFKTEQYPQGLGATHATVAEALPPATTTFEKQSFSCCGAEGFEAALRSSAREQVVLVGMEAHVCVLQTALDLQRAGLEVFVVEDAICSRRLENYQNALDRMRQNAVQVVSAESVVFEWMGASTHPQFKAIQTLLR